MVVLCIVLIVVWCYIVVLFYSFSESFLVCIWFMWIWLVNSENVSLLVSLCMCCIYGGS